MRLGADDEHAIAERLPQCERRPADESPAADRHDDDVDFGPLLRDLEPDRPRALDRPLRIVRMHERPTRLHTRRALDVRLLARRREDDLGAVIAAGLDLVRVRVRRHDDRRRHSSALRRPRERLAVVARARAHDAGAALGRRELRDLIPRAARLEGTCLLATLELRAQLDARIVGGAALDRDDRRPAHDSRQTRRGFGDADVRESAPSARLSPTQVLPSRVHGRGGL